MTFTSSAIAGLFAARDGGFRILPWVFMTLGLMLGHASNNLFNDYTDFVRGVDKENYFRTMYGPQPVAHGLMTTRQLLATSVRPSPWSSPVSSLVFALDQWDPVISAAVRHRRGVRPALHLAAEIRGTGGDFGPGRVGTADDRRGILRPDPALELAGGMGQRPVRAGVTTVILGKHIDKAAMDRQKHIRTLPVLIGEAPARYLVVLFLLAPYVLIAFLVVTKYFTPALAVVLLAVPALVRELPAFFRPKPVEKPEGFPEGEGGWPLYFAPKAFVYTRSFGTWFLLGLVAEVALRIFAPGFWRS